MGCLGHLCERLRKFKINFFLIKEFIGVIYHMIVYEPMCIVIIKIDMIKEYH